METDETRTPEEPEVLPESETSVFLQCAHQVFYRVQLAARFVKDEDVEQLAKRLVVLLERRACPHPPEGFTPPSYLTLGSKDHELSTRMLEECRKLAKALDDFGFGAGYLEQARLADNLGNDDIIFIINDPRLQSILLQVGLREESDDLLASFLKVLVRFKTLYGGLPFAAEIDEIFAQPDHLTHEPFTERWLERMSDVLAWFAKRLAQLKSHESVDVCDFCGDVITGAGYDRLADGRSRCLRCSRTLLSTEEQFKEVFYKTLEMMQGYFGIRIIPRFKLRMVNAKQLHRQIKEPFRKRRGQQASRVLGFAKRNKDGSFELYVENGSPRLALISTLAHELTHIWQYQNWDEKEIARNYGATNRLPIYEGMAVWAQIQYLFFTKEFRRAQREFVEMMQREDEYGIGFRAYFERYSMDFTGLLKDFESPFKNVKEPL